MWPEAAWEMTDWMAIGFSAAGILGAGLLTAALGLANYLAGRREQGLGPVLRGGGFAWATHLGLAMFSLGMVAGANADWARALWGILAAFFAARAWLAERRRRDHDRSERRPQS